MITDNPKDIVYLESVRPEWIDEGLFKADKALNKSVNEYVKDMNYTNKHIYTDRNIAILKNIIIIAMYSEDVVSVEKVEK